MQEHQVSAAGEDWELVSSSEEGEGGLAAEESALAASFLLAEPALVAGQESAQEDEDPASRCIRAVLAGQPPPGSPERLQLLHLEAAPALAPGPTDELAPDGSASRPPWEHQPLSPTTPLSAAAQAAAQSPPVEAAAAPAAPALLLRGSAAVVPGSSAGHAATSASASASASASVTLRVVRSDEQDALQAAMADLEKRASQRDRELVLARIRLSSAQDALAQEARETTRFRRIAMVACSVCAFLGLKALLGGALHHPAGVAAATAASSRGLGVVAHSPHEERCGPSAALHMFAHSPAERDAGVAVLVEPLGP